MNAYTDAIREALARAGHVGVNPYHVEAMMRQECPTLDGLSRARFDSLAVGCVADVQAAGHDFCEQLARMEGVQP